MKIIRLFTILTLFISCNNSIEEKNPILFSEKNYDEAFQLIEYWLDAQKDYEKLPGLTAVITDKDENKWEQDKQKEKCNLKKRVVYVTSVPPYFSKLNFSFYFLQICELQIY